MPSVATQTAVLPGETINTSLLPTSSTGKLKLGPGLQRNAEKEVISVIPGLLTTDNKKNAAWLTSSSGRYHPTAGDQIIGTVHHSTGEQFHVSITPYTTLASLPHLAFENVTKKTRPQLSGGSLVYARILTANKFLEPELVCVNQSTGKAEGMGELKGGMTFGVSLGFARRLLMGKGGGVVVIQELAQRVGFEVAVGRNGVVWVNAASVREIMVVGMALQETDENGLDGEGQKKLVKKLLKGL
jgi:exosome complex component RRP40